MMLGKSKGFPIFIAFILLSITVRSQYLEVGLGLGGAAYTGDLSPHYEILENKLAGNVFFKQNFSNAVSLKYNVMLGKLGASDDPAYDAFGEMRKASFNRFFLEASVQFEYNFIDYLKFYPYIKWTPYFFAGGGVGVFLGDKGPETNRYSRIQPVIPVGIGVKYIIDARWRLGIEAGVRKTFFDYIDNVSGDNNTPIVRNYNYGNPHSKDMYYFGGISLSYTFYNVPCPYNY